MSRGKIIITQIDLNHLHDVIYQAEHSGYRNNYHINQLKKELERVAIIAPQNNPDGVITMNSTVLLNDLENGECLQLTLRYPEDVQSKNEVSVLAPIGCAMLGNCVGDEFEWDVPDGKVRFRVERVLYQIETAGVYD